MPAPINQLKQKLQRHEIQYGLWQSLMSRPAIEIAAQSDFDFLVLDSEHAPVDIYTMANQLSYSDPYNNIIARPVYGESYLIKQYLDIGIQNILAPMIESKEQAKHTVASMRYAPDGFRGVSGSTRAANYGRIGDYLTTANEQVCLIAQIETQKGLDNLDDIIKTDGVDMIFIGPSDLSASLGVIKQIDHPKVQSTIEDIIKRTRDHGKAVGILMGNHDYIARYQELGASLFAVGVDVPLYAQMVDNLVKEYKK